MIQEGKSSPMLTQPTTSLSRNAPIIKPDILCLGMGWFPYTVGGLSRYLHGLSCELAHQGSKVEVLGLGMPEEDANFKSSNLTLTNLADVNTPTFKRLLNVRSEFRRSISSSKTAINLHFALYSFPVINSLPSQIPITFNFHGPWALEGEQEGDKDIFIWLKKQLELYVYRRCDRFIVLSRAFGEVLHQEYRIPWEKIHIIPGGVNTDEFKPVLTKAEARAKLGWDPDRKILFTPRRLVHRVGLDRLLEAMVEIRKVVPDVWLGIAGKGILSQQLEQQIKDLELQDHAKLLGFIPDDLLSLAYQAADITVVPSISWEGFGLILVESLASGTPAISTPIGGMPEILQPLDPNLVTDSTEVSAISDRLIQFLSGQIPLPTSDTCRNYAVDNFDWKHITPRVQEVLIAPK
jgi:glycosyltransferase involved in cell wall biosynthesis